MVTLQKLMDTRQKTLGHAPRTRGHAPKTRGQAPKNRFPAVPKRSIFIKGTPLFGPSNPKIFGRLRRRSPHAGGFLGGTARKFSADFQNRGEEVPTFF